MGVSVYSRAWASMKKIEMQDKVSVVPCRYGYEYLEVACNNAFERDLVRNSAQQIKGAEIESFFPGIYDSIGVIRIHDAKAHSNCLSKIREEMERVEDWWRRYHDADPETKRLMACGKIE